MYIVIYSFKVKPNQEAVFINSWQGLTNLVYKHEDSLGSRLHKVNENEYIAYAQWPDKITFDKAGSKWPKTSNSYRNTMRASCESINILQKMEVVKDLLRTNIYEK